MDPSASAPGKHRQPQQTDVCMASLSLSLQATTEADLTDKTSKDRRSRIVATTGSQRLL